MSVEVYREVPHHQGIASLWNGLAFEMEEPQVFYTWEWALASATAFADTKRPLVALVYEHSKLIGIAALALSAKRGSPVNFLNQGTADYCDFVSRPNVRSRVIAEVLHELATRNIYEFSFSNLPEKSETLICLGDVARKLGYFVTPTTSGRCARLMLRDAEQRKIQKQELLAKRRLKKNLSALRRLGDVTIRDSTDREVIANCLPDFFEAHVARFEATGRASPFLASDRRSFIEAITRLLSHRQWIHMFCLELGGKAIAWGIVLGFCGGWLWYMPTFCLEYERFSPGMILLRMVLEKALDADSVHLVDFGVGEEPYKERFADSAVSIVGQIVTRSRYRYVRAALVTKLATALRQFPEIESRIRGGRERLQKLRVVGQGKLAARGEGLPIF